MDTSLSFFKKTGQEALDSVPSLGSILVWRENVIVSEEYFNGANNATNFQLKSVTKTIVSALAGIAKDKGLLPDLQTPVLNALPEYASDNLKNKNVWYYSFLKEADALKSGFWTRFCAIELNAVIKK